MFFESNNILQNLFNLEIVFTTSALQPVTEVYRMAGDRKMSKLVHTCLQSGPGTRLAFLLRPTRPADALHPRVKLCRKIKFSSHKKIKFSSKVFFYVNGCEITDPGFGFGSLAQCLCVRPVQPNDVQMYVAVTNLLVVPYPLSGRLTVRSLHT